MLCEHALNFDQWKHFPKTISRWEFWLWLAHRFTENYYPSRLFSEFIQTQEVSYVSCQNTYPNSKTTCHNKLQFFLWTKLLENLTLAKYLIYFTAPFNYVPWLSRKFFRDHFIACEDFLKSIKIANRMYLN